MSRRGFLATAGALAAATQTGLLDFTSSLFAAEPKSPAKPRVRSVFIRPNIDKYWMGWPGAAYDIKARQKQYTKILTNAAKKLKVNLQIKHEPLHTDDLVSRFLKEVKENPPDGIILTRGPRQTTSPRIAAVSPRLFSAQWELLSPETSRQPEISPVSLWLLPKTLTGLPSA